MQIDPKVIEFGTERQKIYAEAINRLGTMQATAAELCVDVSAVSHSIKALRKKAARGGVAPDCDLNKPTVPGMFLRGVSTYYDKDGEQAGQWVKQYADKQHAYDQLQEAMQSITDTHSGRMAPLPPPAHECNEDFMTVYPVADPHFGMCAWKEEAQADFNLKIAERVFSSTFDALLSKAPNTKRALLFFLGDIFHSDSARNETTRGTRVDIDSRYPQVCTVGTRCIMYAIDRALTKHQEVEVHAIKGNHDSNSMTMMAVMLAAVYRDEPRVNVVTDHSDHHHVLFGSCLIAGAHGHTAKAKGLALQMAVDWRDDWHRAKHSIWYLGHEHHDEHNEEGGVIIEKLRTMTPNDAWHSTMGYRSGKDLKCDVWHKDRGRTARLFEYVDWDA